MQYAPYAHRWAQPSKLILKLIWVDYLLSMKKIEIFLVITYYLGKFRNIDQNRIVVNDSELSLINYSFISENEA